MFRFSRMPVCVRSSLFSCCSYLFIVCLFCCILFVCLLCFWMRTHTHTPHTCTPLITPHAPHTIHHTPYTTHHTPPHNELLEKTENHPYVALTRTHRILGRFFGEPAAMPRIQLSLCLWLLFGLIIGVFRCPDVNRIFPPALFRRPT